MENKERMSISIDLNKLDGVVVRTGKTGVPVMYINLEECYGFSQDKGGKWWLNVIATQSNGRYGDTHFLTPNISKAEKDALPQGVRTPIIGNIKPMRQQPQQGAPSFAEDDDEDLPF